MVKWQTNTINQTISFISIYMLKHNQCIWMPKTAKTNQKQVSDCNCTHIWFLLKIVQIGIQIQITNWTLY